MSELLLAETTTWTERTRGAPAPTRAQMLSRTISCSVWPVQASSKAAGEGRREITHKEKRFLFLRDGRRKGEKKERREGEEGRRGRKGVREGIRSKDGAHKIKTNFILAFSSPTSSHLTHGLRYRQLPSPERTFLGLSLECPLQVMLG